MTDLSKALDTISRDAAKVVARERRQLSVRPALDAALLVAATIALMFVVILGIAHAIDAPLEAPAGWIIALAIVVPALVFFVTTFPNRRDVRTDEALALADERHGLQDRLRTAHEFLQTDERTPFMEAAVQDAAAHADRARIRNLHAQPAPTSLSTLGRRLIPVVLLASIGAVLIPSSQGNATETPVVEHKPAIEKLDDEVKPRRTSPTEPPVPVPTNEVVSAKRPPGKAPQAAGSGRKDMQLDSDVKKTRGAMGSGQSADAASASGNSEARGAPSSQAQASKAGKKPKKKKKKKKKRDRKPPEQTPTEAKKPENDSGATAGRGAASGSNKSPSASPWSSKDQVTSEDEEDLEDDEEVDDEFDNSDARGGVQPHLRDRRPPVNRDLGIGFGNGKNPDANGRGGPSELKKSRGVAALVLGVPIPDHIKGRPNPGKTKITQERVEPQVEDPTPATASARAPRQAPIGHFADPKLDAWMRNLIRDYFKAIRPKSTKTPKTSGD